MLSFLEAKSQLEEAFPGAKIGLCVEYQDLYICQVFLDLPFGEGQFDPYYSVDMNTGVITDFSVVGDNMDEIMALFDAAKKGYS